MFTEKIHFQDITVLTVYRLHNDLFLPPNGADGWPTDVIFQVVYR